MTREDAIRKVAKIRELAASEAGLGNESAVMSFGTTMQRLMLQHDISDAELDEHGNQQKQDEPVIEHAMYLRSFGLAGTKSNSALDSLASCVAKAHLCRIIYRRDGSIEGRGYFPVFIGTQAHCEVAELVLRALWKSLGRLASEGQRKAKREGADLRSYTTSFKQSFVWRLQERYDAERRDVLAAANRAQAVREAALRNDGTELGEAPELREPSQALMVVERHIERAKSYLDAKYGKLTSRRTGYSGGNSRGSADGTSAANSVPMRSHGIAGNTSRGQLGA
jgi:hypothetical protein